MTAEKAVLSLSADSKAQSKDIGNEGGSGGEEERKGGEIQPYYVRISIWMAKLI